MNMNIKKFFWLILACKSTVDSVYNKRKCTEGNIETEEDKSCKKFCLTKKDDFFTGFDSSQITNVSECYESLDSVSTIKNPLMLENDNWFNLESEDAFFFTTFKEFQQVETPDIENSDIQKLSEQEVNFPSENVIPANIPLEKENFFNIVDADYKLQEGDVPLEDELISRLNTFFDEIQNQIITNAENEETQRLIEEIIDIDPTYNASTADDQKQESISEMALPLKSQNENIDKTVFQDLNPEILISRNFQNIEVPESVKDKTESLIEEVICVAQIDDANTSIVKEVEDTVDVAATFCEQQSEEFQEIPLQDDALKRLKVLYSQFIRSKYGDKNGEFLNRCLALFPETLALLYLKVKNNESDEYINNLFLKIFNLYTENIILSCREKINDVYEKRINFRQGMLNILKSEIPNLGNYILLYEILSICEKTSFNIQKLIKAQNFLFTKNITNAFNIIIFLDDNDIILFKQKIDEMLQNIHVYDDFILINDLDFDGLDLKAVLNNIIVLKKMYDLLLIPINSCKERRQTLNKYYNNELRKLQTNQYDSLNSSDITRALNGLEFYKDTFKACSSANSVHSFMNFLHKIKNRCS